MCVRRFRNACNVVKVAELVVDVIDIHQGRRLLVFGGDLFYLGRGVLGRDMVLLILGNLARNAARLLD